jgi:hypothetical protein
MKAAVKSGAVVALGQPGRLREGEAQWKVRESGMPEGA